METRMTNDIDVIKLSSIEITHDRVAEFDDRRMIKSIPRNEITSITLNYGVCSEHIIIQAVFSILTIMIGLYMGLIPTCELIYDIYTKTGVDAGHSYINKGPFILIFPMFFIPFGIYSFILTFRRRHYLLVKTKNDKRHIVFNNTVSINEISFFIHTAKEKYGYTVDSNL